jgi:hypothetical protein
MANRNGKEQGQVHMRVGETLSMKEEQQEVEQHSRRRSWSTIKKWSMRRLRRTSMLPPGDEHKAASTCSMSTQARGRLDNTITKCGELRSKPAPDKYPES